MSLRGVLLRQKEEWERSQQRNLVKRDAFEFASRQMESELIKVIVGPRRAGKSAFAAMLLRGKNAAYLNFDEVELEGVNVDTVLAELYAVYPGCDHVFFDEIQNLEGWPLALNRLQRDGKNIIVTGSNAHMLSGELMTHLTGRHVPIEILPFSFAEYLRAKGVDTQQIGNLPEDQALVLRHFDVFLSRGGYPETVMNAALDAGSYLSSVWNSIIYTDVVSRRSIRRPQAIADIGTYVLANAGVPGSFRGIGEEVGIESPITAEKYLGWLQEAYLIAKLTRYSHRVAGRTRSPKKYYPVDNGLIAAVAVRTSPNYGRLFENLVMNELRKSGSIPERTLFYHKAEDGAHEVDFVLRRDSLHVTDLVQVCWDMRDSTTRRRELSGLRSAHRQYSVHGLVDMTIVTRDQEETIMEDGVSIAVVPFWKWATKERRP